MKVPTYLTHFFWGGADSDRVLAETDPKFVQAISNPDPDPATTEWYNFFNEKFRLKICLDTGEQVFSAVIDKYHSVVTGSGSGFEIAWRLCTNFGSVSAKTLSESAPPPKKMC